MSKLPPPQSCLHVALQRLRVLLHGERDSVFIDALAEANVYGAIVGILTVIDDESVMTGYIIRDTRAVEGTLMHYHDRIFKRCPAAGLEWRTIKNRHGDCTWIDE